MADQDKSFQDVMDDIDAVEVPHAEAEEDEDNSPAPPAADDSTGESPSAEDKEIEPESDEAEAEPEAEDEPADKAEGDEPDEAPDEDADAEELDAEDGAEAEADEEEEPEGEEPTFEIDGETYTAAELKEFRDSGLRHADYTRKMQEVSQMRERLQEEAESAKSDVQDRLKLADEIAEDEDMQDFLRAHPDAISYLMREPEATRSMLGSTRKIHAFQEDYETIMGNPRLREKFLEGSEEESPEEAAQDPEIVRARQARTVQNIAAELDRAVDHVAEKYPGVDKEEVARYVLELGGVPIDNPDFERTVEAFSNLYRLFFVQTESGIQIDTKLIQDRFDTLAQGSSRRDPEESKAERHNKKVDEELGKESEEALVTGGDGSAPAQAEDTGPAPGEFRDVLNSLSDHD